MFMVSYTPSTFLDHPSHHGNNPLRKSCALVTAVELALHLKMNSTMSAEDEKMVDYRPFRFVSSVFPSYKKVISIVQDLERG